MNCEQVQIAAMALAEGEAPLLPRAEVEAHAKECTECRQAIAGLNECSRKWESQTRRPREVDMWPRIEHRISPRGHRWLPALVAVLVVLKLIEFTAHRTFGTWIQLVPLLLAALAFAFAGSNPFEIKTEMSKLRKNSANS